MKRLLLQFLTFGICCAGLCVADCCLPCSAGNLLCRHNDDFTSVTNTYKEGVFPLVSNGTAAALVIDPLDAEVVSIAAEAFSGDVQQITGIKPVILAADAAMSLPAAPVIIGTLGQSLFIDSLVASGKISAADIGGKWESFCIAAVSSPFDGISEALVIYGSDPRGTAFGVFELSRMMGVSPLVWWADVAPEQQANIYITHGESIFGPPSVQYRGLFINDEDWGLQPWAAKNMDTNIKDIGPKTYAKVFELLLRMKANYLWPAMHPSTKAFWYYPGNPEMARKYHIVLGSSHAEPLLRNNVDEWAKNFTTEYGMPSGDWNWAINSTNITRYWTDRVIQSKNNDAVYTVGMRGIHDSAMPGYSDNESKKNALKDVIATQRNILSTNLGKQASKIPQIFCPYKETLSLYKLGLNLADDITITWADDNHGYIRQLSNPQEQLRGGGAGVYYHISYWGDPADYLWLSSVSPSLISYELCKAYELNTRKLWVINVGDIKPAEMEFQFAMDLAWDINAWKPENAQSYSKYWAETTFGKEFSESIANIKNEYYRLAASGKPEHLHLITYPDEEIDQRIEDYGKLVEASKIVESQIPARLKDAYFQLIAYPVEAAASMNEKALYAQKSLKLASQGDKDALSFSGKAKSAYQNIITLTNKYNKETASGKWNGIMDYAPRKLSQFYEPTVATESSISGNGIPGEHESIVTIIPVDSFTNKNEAGYTVCSIAGLGIGQNALTVWPLNLTAYNQENINNAPYVDYTIPAVEGTNKIEVRCLPTFPLYEAVKLRYAVSVDNADPVFVDITTSEGASQWSKNVLQGFTSQEISYQSDSDKEINLRIYLADPGLVLSAVYIKRGYADPFTEYLKNPSFELKADGEPGDGSVVRGTPYGWEQNGTVQGNSYGTSSDASDFDGNNICWYNVNQSPFAMPDGFELYQTIEGLPAGEYAVRCKLAVMTGYQTNVRLFANNYVQYYGSASNYVNNLTDGEVNSFAGWTPASGMTKASLKDMAVKVIIYENDSLKLGIRSSNKKSDGSAGTGSNASNVHGGFKVDHFRLECLKLYPTREATKETLDSLITVARELYRNTGNGNNLGIYTNESRTVFNGSIDEAQIISNSVQSSINKLITEINSLYDAISVYKKSFVSYALMYLKNPGFEYEAEDTPFNATAVVRGKPYGWEQTGSIPGNSFGINFKDAVNFEGSGYCWYNVNETPFAMPAGFELYQIVSGLPAGEYIVRCNLATMENYMTNVRLFANNNVQYYGQETDYGSNLTAGEVNTFASWTGAANMTNPALKEMSVKVVIQKDETLKLGIRSGNMKSDGSASIGLNASNVPGTFKADNFQIEKCDVLSSINAEASGKEFIRISTVENTVCIDVNKVFNHGNIALYSITGKQLQNKVLLEGRNYLNINSKGMYIIKIAINNEQFIEKIIVK
ncbi:MAG: glycosyl hydrolase 115 family protein [Dysgonamonadaceae bacterium]|nr:glycosyl hydrolase 115 family protein [Dysgonamonadaceae bacterium]